MPVNVWTPDAEDALRAMYGNTSIYKLAQIFGTTESSIAHKAMRMGISKKNKTIHAPKCLEPASRNTDPKRKRFMLRAKTLTRVKRELDEALG